MGLLLLASRFLSAMLLAAATCVLRRTVHRRTGVGLETIVVLLTLLLLTVALAPHQIVPPEDLFRLSFVGSALFVLALLPLLVGIDMAESLMRREKWQLVDLFRLTTAVSFAVFAFLTFPGKAQMPLGLLFASIVVMAERATSGRHVGRYTALVFVTGFLLATVALILFSGVSLHYLAYSGPSWSDVGSWAELCGLLAVVAAAVVTPPIVQAIAVRSSWVHIVQRLCLAIHFRCVPPSRHARLASASALWHFRRHTCFLNHGSFGAVPLWLQDQRYRWQQTAEEQPMDFFSRRAQECWLEARFQLAMWLGTKAENIALCENATAGMNELATWFPLQPGDEVLLNNHEYGAVRRIWERACERNGARLVVVSLPQPFESREAITESLLAACTPRTRLVVLSHITSPTAVILPVSEICRELKSRNIASCVDGPHALLQEDVKLNRLGCDFYTGSCHKWLCAPRGSGFVYVAPTWHALAEPARLSWGRLPPQPREQWWDELIWTGTRDFSAYLTVPAAIRFFQSFNRQQLDTRNHRLATYARQRLLELPDAEPVTPEGRQWYGWMVAVWLPPRKPLGSNSVSSETASVATGSDGPGRIAFTSVQSPNRQTLNEEHPPGAETTLDYANLQQRLFQKHGIEVPIVPFGNRWLIRVSCHLYNHTGQIDQLYRALREELGDG